MESQLQLFGSIAERSISSPEAFPVSHTPSPAVSSAKKIRGTSGHKWHESLPRSGPLGFFSRMFLTFRRPLSTLFSETLKLKATTGGRFVTQLTLSALPTGESGSSLWPTTDASIFNDGQSVEAYLERKQKERLKNYNGNGGGTPLAMAVRLEELGLWPTATSRDAHGSRRETAKKESWTSNDGTTLLDAALTEEDLWATQLGVEGHWPSGFEESGVHARQEIPLRAGAGGGVEALGLADSEERSRGEGRDGEGTGWRGGSGLANQGNGERAEGPTESRLGRVLDGISAWLDGYVWPSLRGQHQFFWEPPRLSSRRELRNDRLRALGNAVVPQQVYPLLALIKFTNEEIEDAFERGL